MNVVIRGRNVEVPEHFQAHVTEKLAPSAKLDSKISAFDVELYHERNPRQASACQRIEITCRTRGPVVRAEATAADFYSALDLAVGKLEMRLRRSHDRRSDRKAANGRSAAAGAGPLAPVAGAVEVAAAPQTLVDEVVEERDDVVPGHVVRVKQHEAEPMTVEDALFEMEMVGHDFYLFADKESGLASVVYRRKGYDYGVIRLAP